MLLYSNLCESGAQDYHERGTAEMQIQRQQWVDKKNGVGSFPVSLSSLAGLETLRAIHFRLENVQGKARRSE
jgi:hypothetical protein